MRYTPCFADPANLVTPEEPLAPDAENALALLQAIYRDVLPGTELSFASEVKCVRSAFLWSERVISYKTAIFRWVRFDGYSRPRRRNMS
jgi:hypothetical protein